MYSLSCKIVHSRENFWNVYCFVTNQMWDETAKDNGQTAAGISHDLIRNNELALYSKRNLKFSLSLYLWKAVFTTNLHKSLESICSKTNLPNWPENEGKLWKFTTVQVRVTGKGFTATKKMWIKNHQSQLTSMLAWPFELHIKQTQRNIACDWLIFSHSQTRCLAVSDRLILSSWFNNAFL